MGTLEQQSKALPLPLPPTGMRRTQAAAYIGVFPTKFDEMVLQGTMPQPKEIGARRLDLPLEQMDALLKYRNWESWRNAQ